jgi:hypothetical protein
MEVFVLLRSGVLSAAIILFSFQAVADSLPFSYSLVNLGGGEYQYDYSIYNNASLGAGVPVQLFDVDFDPTLYTNLSIVTPNPNWTEMIFPAGGGNPALFDVSSPTNGGIPVGSTASGFDVDFDWLGTGTPGSQPFQIYDPNSFAQLQNGNTINPVPLGTLTGGTASDPGSFPAGDLVGSVVAPIGAGSPDYYSFMWAGGNFNVTASVQGTEPGGASFIFSYGVSGNGGCSNLGTTTLDSADNFTGIVGNNAALAAGRYCIGINATGIDPVTITFNTPVESTVPTAPEPSTSALLLAGTGLFAGTVMKSVLRRRRAARKA